jgi:hypothetical protein
MNFTTFWTKLQALEKGIAITSPVAKQVKAAYWGGPNQAFDVGDLPCVINALAEPDRSIGFGTRDQRLRVNVQLLAAKATVEDAQSSLIATAFWFAAKDKFDEDITVGGTVSLSVLKGFDPTVPVILQHAGQAYIGFSAVLEIQDVEEFTFG